MDQPVYVAQLNVDHYRRQLASEQDAVKRQMIVRLLAEEEIKLAALNNPPRADKAEGSKSLPASSANVTDATRHVS